MLVISIPTKKKDRANRRIIIGEITVYIHSSDDWKRTLVGIESKEPVEVQAQIDGQWITKFKGKK